MAQGHIQKDVRKRDDTNIGAALSPPPLQSLSSDEDKRVMRSAKRIQH